MWNDSTDLFSQCHRLCPTSVHHVNEVEFRAGWCCGIRQHLIQIMLNDHLESNLAHPRDIPQLSNVVILEHKGLYWSKAEQRWVGGLEQSVRRPGPLAPDRAFVGPRTPHGLDSRLPPYPTPTRRSKLDQIRRPLFCSNATEFRNADLSTVQVLARLN